MGAVIGYGVTNPQTYEHLDVCKCGSKYLLGAVDSREFDKSWWYCPYCGWALQQYEKDEFPTAFITHAVGRQSYKIDGIGLVV
jgi:hypothetical protein